MGWATFTRRVFVSTFAVLVPAIYGGALCAADAWVLRGAVESPPCDVVGPLTYWTADVNLHNTNASDATVTVLDVSNDGAAHQPLVLVPAGGAAELGLNSLDFQQATVWIDHLDVPDGVVVEGRLEYRVWDCSAKPQQIDPIGKVSSPVWRELTPAGVAKLHAGTDLGTQNARVNVGIYNAADVFATAVIQVKRSLCAQLTPVTRTVSVPPHWLIQTSVFEAPPLCVFGPDATTTVTVDQPSLSYAVTLSNGERLPNVTYGFASP